MPLGAWIFLSVVLLLVVLHKPFRKFFFWAVGISAACYGLFIAYSAISNWHDRQVQAREAAILKKRHDDCVVRLTETISKEVGSAGLSNFHYLDDSTPDQVCTVNPDVTSDEAIALHSPPPPMLSAPDASQDMLSASSSGVKKSTSPAPETVEGTVTTDSVMYSESQPGGPGGQVVGRIEKGSRVRVIRRDSIFDNVLVRAPSGKVGWLPDANIDY